jgi:hypothetical protein
MPVEPLFVVDYEQLPSIVPSMDELQTMIRLVPSRTTDPTNDVVDKITQNVRVKLYGALGEDLVNTLLAIVPEENPTSSDGLSRLQATILEANWVLYLLLIELPVCLYDSVAAEPPEQAWDKEPLTRDIDPDTLELRRDALWEEIQDLLGDLTGAVGDNSVKVGDIGPSDTYVPHAPGSSIVPYGQYLNYSGFDSADYPEGYVILI